MSETEILVEFWKKKEEKAGQIHLRWISHLNCCDCSKRWVSNVIKYLKLSAVSQKVIKNAGISTDYSRNLVDLEVRTILPTESSYFSLTHIHHYYRYHYPCNYSILCKTKTKLSPVPDRQDILVNKFKLCWPLSSEFTVNKKMSLGTGDMASP